MFLYEKKDLTLLLVGNRNLFSGTTISVLTQTNCIVLPSTLLMPEGRSRKYGYVELVDGLLSQGYVYF